MRLLRGIVILWVMLLSLTIYAQEATCNLNSIESYSTAGYTEYSRGNYENAIVYYTCAIELDGKYVDAYKVRGDTYSNLGDYDAAIADFDQAIEIDPEYAGAYLNRGWAYLLRGDPIPHQDFFIWVLLEETTSLDADLLETMNAGNLPIARGYVYRFQFEATAGTQFGAAAISADLTDPLLILLDGNGVPITSDDDGGVNLNSVISPVELPENSVYTLVLSQAGGYGSGEVELSIYLDGDVQSTNPDNPNIVNNFLVYNLYINETAEVFTTGGDRLNVRREPTLSSPVVTQVAARDRVTLLAGPVKADGYKWWEISTADGTQGWAVERVVTEQTLQLALLPGEDAFVTSGDDLLNVRDGSGRDFNVIFQLEDGVVVTLLNEEPVIRDGFQWWHIHAADGREGWTVDRIGLERTLVPVREFPQRATSEQ